jgi:hypothetical protein
LGKLRTVLQGAAHAGLWDRVHLVLAGGYDARVLEDVEYYKVRDFIPIALPSKLP